MLKPFSAIAIALFACGLPFAVAADELDLQPDAFVTDKATETPLADNGPVTITDKADKPKAEEPATPATESAAPAEETKGDGAKKCSESSSCSTKCEDTSSCGEECACGDACGSETPGCCSFLEKLNIKNCLGMECCSNWEIGGWSEAGYTNNNVPLSQAYNDLLSFNDVPDHLHLNQQWVYLGKVADGKCGLDWGARVDFLYGTDAQKTQAFGNPGAGVRNEGSFDASWDNGEYGFAMPQLYGEVAYGDTSVKIGHFFTPLGYEVVPATGNFF